jgi:magnesium transporter
MSITPPEAQRFDDLHQVLEQGSMRQAARMLNALESAEIAQLLQSLPPG